MNLFCVYPDLELQKRLFANAEASSQSAGSYLFREGDLCNKLFYLKKGKVRIFINSENGNEVVEQFSQEGCILGLPTAVRNEKYLLNVEVVEDSEMLAIPANKLREIMNNDAGVCLKLVELLSKEVESLKQGIRELGRAPTIH